MGWPKSSVAAACARIGLVAQVAVDVGGGALRALSSSWWAWARTMGS